MPIYTLTNGKAKKVAPTSIALEKDIQRLVEVNLEEILDIHFLASEYTTSFGGRIDSLGIDKTGSPVIIEYKKGQNDNVINQALSYLRWLLDHKAEFEKLVNIKMTSKNIPGNTNEEEDNFIEWDSPRVICMAQSFNKFDLDTVAVLPINIELIKYKTYENNILSIDFEATKEISTDNSLKHNKIKTLTTKQKEYTIDFHLNKTAETIKELYITLREKIMALDDSIVEESKAKYIAFKLSTNFVDVTIYKNSLKLFLNMHKGELNDPQGIARDVSEIGHWGNGDYEIVIKDKSEIDYVFDLIKQSYQYNS